MAEELVKNAGPMLLLLLKLICPVLLIRACKYITVYNFYLSPPAALAQWLDVLVLDTGYSSLPGGSCDGRNPENPRFSWLLSPNQIGGIST